MLSDTHQHKHLRQQSGYRRIEVITGQQRRRQWSDEEKARIVSESFLPGANVSGVARRHGVSGGLLFKWRRAAQMQQAPAAIAPFIPVMLADGGSGDGDAPSTVQSGAIEVELAGACIRIQSTVSKTALKTVLAALRETA